MDAFAASGKDLSLVEGEVKRRLQFAIKFVRFIHVQNRMVATPAARYPMLPNFSLLSQSA